MRRGKLRRFLSLFGIGIERFTDRLRAALAYAEREAHRWNHEYIGTEHYLVGLIREGTGVGAKAMQNLRVDHAVLENELNKVLKKGLKRNHKNLMNWFFRPNPSS